MEISFRNINFPYKKVTFLLFSEILVCLLFLKTNSSTESYAKRHILWWHIWVSLNTKWPSGLQVRGLGLTANQAALKIRKSTRELWSWACQEQARPQNWVGALHKLCPSPAWLWSHRLERAGENPAAWKQFHRQIHFFNQLQGCSSLSFGLFPTVAFRGAIWKAQTGSAFQSCLASTCCCGVLW